jgi:hypothetical protein
MHIFEKQKNKVREKVPGKKGVNGEANSFPELRICSNKSRK